MSEVAPTTPVKATAEPVKKDAHKSVSHWRRAGRVFMHEPFAVASLIFLILIVLMAIFAPAIARYEPNAQDLQNRFAGPSSEHWLGTDNLGRDTWSRLVYGARTSLMVTFLVGFFAYIIAVPLGLISGYFSGKIDVLVMRISEAFMSIPPLVLALAIAGILGPGVRNMVIALVAVFVPGLVRVVRGQALAVREETFIDASRAIGTSKPTILAKRVFPHVLSPVLVQLSIALGTILVVEASLSFLGLGDPPPNASWGSMLQQGFQLMATDARLILVPSIAIALATLAFNAVGDGLRDALAGAGAHKRKRGDVLGTTTVLLGLKSAKAVETKKAGETDGVEPGAEPAAPAVATNGSNGSNGSSDAVISAKPSTPKVVYGGATQVAKGPAVPAGAAPAADVVLEIRDLTVGFDGPDGIVPVLDKVNLQLRRGEILGLVGESGCGKTVTSQSILRLIPSPPGRIMGGQVLFDGKDLIRLNTRQLRAIRGRDIAMIFQDPMASLNPAFTIGDQIVEAQRLHRNVSKAAARTRAAELLDLVGIPDAKRRLDDYPHTFSGGMRQRALIAMALSNDPKILIADEPTTALDVTVQAQILQLIRDLREEFGMSVLFVTHDLGVVQELCDRVSVMYAGQVVENCTVDQIFDNPQHPYSAALLKSRPRLADDVERLVSIPGLVPSPAAMPEGCRFHARCGFATEACAAAPVPIEDAGDGQLVRCIRHDEIDLTTPTDTDRSDLEVAKP
jgi:peptide/nickel transport system permease protein